MALVGAPSRINRSDTRLTVESITFSSNLTTPSIFLKALRNLLARTCLARQIKYCLFSVLKMDVSDPRERKKPQSNVNNIGSNNKNTNASAKNKQQHQNKKNKKKESNNNNKKKSQQGAVGGAGSGEQEKFNQWKKRDEELVDDLFEKELQEALLQSRLEQEGQKQQPSPGPTVNGDQGLANRRSRVTLSLAEFHEKFAEEPAALQPSREPLSKLLAQMKQQEEEEQALRRQAAREAAAILTREKVADEVRERAQQPRVVPQEEYDRMLEMKKKQIEHMAKVLNQTHKEMAVLQEQNADLEFMVSKGEMRKKVELIREVEELRLVKDELTDQIAQLHVSLEQEKSKVHQLTLELQKRR
ncbi:G kinase-anchoring protein 1-like isoform X1 [Varroa destructor]|uniref:G kinase-anchoring protein 1 n=1 Tax=Varroa destructor TaxID=109461 RepID=A0A7M7KKM9_VARDE|nr:G kinase-anchoring protein 1-like isoform X1 [Varroa destructor]